MSPLNILIPKSKSLGVIGARHHLALRRRLYLPSYLWLQLEQWLSRTEHRSNLRRSDAQPRAIAWLMLMHQLTLVLHHASAVLQHKSLVHHPLEVLNVSKLQSIG
jgi:hypothetical protein